MLVSAPEKKHTNNGLDEATGCFKIQTVTSTLYGTNVVKYNEMIQIPIFQKKIGFQNSIQLNSIQFRFSKKVCPTTP